MAFSHLLRYPVLVEAVRGIPPTAGLFLPTDFSPSPHWLQRHPNHEAYQSWAANEANEVKSAFDRGIDPRTALKSVAFSRMILNQQLRQDNPGIQDTAGKPRDDRSAPSTTMISEIWGNVNGLEYLPLVEKLEFHAVELDQYRLGVGVKYDSVDAHDLWQVRAQPDYSKTDREVHSYRVAHVTRYKFWGKWMYNVLHLGSSAEEGLKDAFDRYSLAKKATTNREKLMQAILATRSYFGGMPFETGSASIGRSYWSGALSHLFGRKIVLPVDIDHHAMLSETSDYVVWLNAVLREQLGAPTSLDKDW